MASLRTLPTSTAQIIQASDVKDTPTTSQEQKATISTLPDLKSLDQFNPALVYAFEPEGPVIAHSGPLGYARHMSRQHEDVLNAYLYAQTEILPAIAKTGIALISSEQLLQWVNQIHLRMAKTMAENQSLSQIEFKSGEYTNEPISRWHAGKEIQAIIFGAIQILAKHKPHDSGILKTAQTMLNKFPQLNSTGVSKEERANELRDFLKILLEIHNSQIKIPKEFLSTVKFVEELDMMKLFFHYHQGGLDENKKNIIKKFVKFGLLPSKIVVSMEAFSKNLLKKWIACDGNDPKKIAELACFAFSQLVDIHPYFNGNGRTATCLMNVILCSFKKSSILLRYPGEKDDPSSLYSRALEQFDSNRTFLQELIETRMKEAQAKPYQDELKENIC